MRRPLLLPILLTLISTVGAKADDLTYTATPSGAEFLYQFNLLNTGITGGTVYDLFLSIPLDIGNIDTSNIGTPVGWGDPSGGLLFFGPDVNPSTSFIEWAADASGLDDVAIGDSLSGFSFLSFDQIPSAITYALNGSSTFATARLISTVPEPDFVVPVLLTFLWLLLPRHNSKREPSRRSRKG